MFRQCLSLLGNIMIQKLRASLGPLNRLKPAVISYYCPFQGGSVVVVVRVACFGVSFCTVFTFFISRRV